MASVASGGGTVLVVEDNEVSREGLASILQREGYVVITAADGQEALDRLRGGLAPSLILLDMMLPVVDGWRFLDLSRREAARPVTPVLITTGLGVASPEWACALGAAGFLRKPIETAALLGEVRRCLAN